MKNGISNCGESEPRCDTTVGLLFVKNVQPACQCPKVTQSAGQHGPPSYQNQIVVKKENGLKTFECILK